MKYQEGCSSCGENHVVRLSHDNDGEYFMCCGVRVAIEEAPTPLFTDQMHLTECQVEELSQLKIEINNFVWMYSSGETKLSDAELIACKILSLLRPEEKWILCNDTTRQAEKIVDELMTNGNGEKADRLALRQHLEAQEERDLGGYCRKSAIELVASIMRSE